MTTRGAVLDSPERPADSAGHATAADAPSRRARMGEARSRRRSLRRRGTIAVLLATGVVVIPLVIGNSVRGNDAKSSTRAAAGTPGVRTTLFAITRDDGTAASTMLLADGRHGAPSTAVAVPGALELETPGLDRQRIADLPVLGGAGTLGLAVENLLGIRLDSTVVIPPDAARAALAEVAPLAIDLRNPVDLSAVTGGRMFTDGPQQITAAEAWLLLSETPPGGELDHLDAARAVLASWAAAEVRLPTPAASVAPVAAIGTSRAAFQVLPMKPSGVGDVQRFTLDRNAAPGVLRRWFPDAFDHSGTTRPKVEIRNGSGAVGITQEAAVVVVPLGSQVTLTGNVEGFGVAESRVSYYRRADAATAHAIATALGISNVSRIERNVNVVDITVVLGTDFVPPATNQGSAPIAAAPSAASATGATP